MTSKRETVLSALSAALAASFALSPIMRFERGMVLPDEAPPGGLVILRDGKPGEPEVTLSPLMYHYQHRAEIEIFVQSAETDRDALFDRIAQRIGTVLAADRTLGGLCDWTEPEAPEPQDLPVAGGATIKAAVIAVTLHYSTPDPLI